MYKGAHTTSFQQFKLRTDALIWIRLLFLFIYIIAHTTHTKGDPQYI